MKRILVATLVLAAGIALSGGPVLAKANKTSCQQIRSAMEGKTAAEVAKQFHVSVDRVNHCTGASKSTSAKHSSKTTAAKSKQSTTAE